MAKVIAILQARQSSQRLPGKVLLPILGMPMLALQIEREKRSQLIQDLIVATSEEPSDDGIAELCDRLNVACFRGSLNDVLDRFYRAAKDLSPDWIVRLTGDCPLGDPAIIDAVIGYCLENDFDYATNALEPTFPDGMDVEVLRYSCLEEAWREARLGSEREHVTSFINRRPDRYRIGIFRSNTDKSHLRWTVDEPEDFALVTRIFEALYPSNPHFEYLDILELVEKDPELQSINTRHERNEGYRKSLEQDANDSDA